MMKKRTEYGESYRDEHSFGISLANGSLTCYTHSNIFAINYGTAACMPGSYSFVRYQMRSWLVVE